MRHNVCMTWQQSLHPIVTVSVKTVGQLKSYDRTVTVRKLESYSRELTIKGWSRLLMVQFVLGDENPTDTWGRLCVEVSVLCVSLLINIVADLFVTVVGLYAVLVIFEARYLGRQQTFRCWCPATQSPQILPRLKVNSSCIYCRYLNCCWCLLFFSCRRSNQLGLLSRARLACEARFWKVASGNARTWEDTYLVFVNSILWRIGRTVAFCERCFDFCQWYTTEPYRVFGNLMVSMRV
jgi:hypothetical protein